MGKTYQAGKIDTSELIAPDTVNVVLAELAGEVYEGLAAVAVAPGCR